MGEEDEFQAVITSALNVLLLGLETRLEASLTQMARISWSSLESVRPASPSAACLSCLLWLLGRHWGVGEGKRGGGDLAPTRKCIERCLLQMICAIKIITDLRPDSHVRWGSHWQLIRLKRWRPMPLIESLCHQQGMAEMGLEAVPLLQLAFLEGRCLATAGNSQHHYISLSALEASGTCILYSTRGGAHACCSQHP